MKKLVTSPLTNTIYWASVNEKKGMIVGDDKKDVTDNAIDAVFYHLIGLDKFKEKGFSGYEIPRKEDDSFVTLCVVDSKKYKVVPIEEV